MKFSFLHSANSNIALFSQALEGAGFEPRAHYVRSDLLDSVTEKGGIDTALFEEIAGAIRRAASGVDLVLLTCSSLSPVVDQLKEAGVPVERTDRLLAEEVFDAALQEDGPSQVSILVAAPTTIGPTKELFETVRHEMGADGILLRVELLPMVWDLFLAGNFTGYREALSKAIDDFLDGNEASHVVLGQASMGPALAGCQSGKAASVRTVAGATRSFLARKA